MTDQNTNETEQSITMIEENADQEIKKPSGNVVKDYIFLFSIAGGITLLDQITKLIVVENIQYGGRWMPLDWLSPYFQIVNWRNTGAAFGMFQNGSLFFTILAIIVPVIIIYYFPQIPKNEWPLRLALSMQMGGALGNLADRLQYGYVVDFIAVGNFPVFNIADSSIFMGVVILLVGIWVLERKEKKSLATQEQIVSE